MYFKKFILIFILLFSFPFYIISESPATTFPKETAGISAYIKVDNITEENNAEKLNEVQAFLEQEGTTISASSKHVIGTIPISIVITDNSGNDRFLSSISTNIYFDIEGWMVAYLNKEEPSSKIIQWTGYSPNNIPPTILEEAIEKVTNSINHTYSPVEYYHFQYENAEKIAIIIDIADSTGDRTKNYSVTTPGTVYEASYSLYYSTHYNNNRCSVSLTVNNERIIGIGLGYWCSQDTYIYDFYPENTFLSKTPNSVITTGWSIDDEREMRIGGGTILVYGVD